MERGIVFVVIVVFLCADFIIERILEYLNRRAMSLTLPENLKGIYDEKEYERFRNYKCEYDRFGLFGAVFSFVMTLAVLYAGGFGWWNAVVTAHTDNTILQALLFMLGLSMVVGMAELPFDWYAIFHIEEKYGFNKTTFKTYVADLLKSMLLSGIIGGMLLAGLVWFYEWIGPLFWLYAWGGITLFSLFMTLFYSQLIVPLFNKQIALEEGSLRNKISEFIRQTGLRLEDIYVIDSSRRTTKANAYFTGFGPKKRIVLYDSLIQELTEEEIVAVLAHEVGHYKRKHTVKFMLVSVLQTGIMLWLFSWFVNQPALSEALGGDKAYFQLGIVAFALLYTPINMVLGVFVNIWSRKNEYEADSFAVRHGQGDYLISGLKKISVKSLSNLTPHPFYEWVYYSHPSLLKRMKAMEDR